MGQKEEMNCGEAGGIKEGETESWRKPLESELKTQATLHSPVRGTSYDSNSVQGLSSWHYQLSRLGTPHFAGPNCVLVLLLQNPCRRNKPVHLIPSNLPGLFGDVAQAGTMNKTSR